MEHMGCMERLGCMGCMQMHGSAWDAWGTSKGLLIQHARHPHAVCEQFAIKQAHLQILKNKSHTKQLGHTPSTNQSPTHMQCLDAASAAHVREGKHQALD